MSTPSKDTERTCRNEISGRSSRRHQGDINVVSSFRELSRAGGTGGGEGGYFENGPKLTRVEDVGLRTQVPV